MGKMLGLLCCSIYGDSDRSGGEAAYSSQPQRPVSQLRADNHMLLHVTLQCALQALECGEEGRGGEGECAPLSLEAPSPFKIGVGTWPHCKILHHTAHPSAGSSLC